MNEYGVANTLYWKPRKKAEGYLSVEEYNKNCCNKSRTCQRPKLLLFPFHRLPSPSHIAAERRPQS